MAFGARRVYPNDTRPRVAIGVNLPFSEPGVFTPNFQTRDAVKNNLINYLLTNPGERLENPTFGAGIRFAQYGFDFGYTHGEEGHPRANTMFFSLSVKL